MASILLLAVLVPAVPAAARQWLTKPPVGIEDAAFLKRVRQATDETRLQAKLQAASGLLARTPTGAPLVRLVREGKVRVIASMQAGPFYSDKERTVHYTLDFLKDGETWQHAVILAHELEHARQDLEGVSGDAVRGLRETAAFLVQCRVWVELGGKVREKDLARNGINSQDMLAFLDFPNTPVAAILTRADYPLRFATAAARRYWDRTRADQAVWRMQWRTRFPVSDSRSAALYILNQAAEARKAGAVSPWLPEILEMASSIAPGKTLDLPGAPTLADRLLLGSLGMAINGSRLRASANLRPQDIVPGTLFPEQKDIMHQIGP